jgi:hypothetical protein
MRPALLIFGLVLASSAFAQQSEAQKPEQPTYSVVEPKKPAKAKATVRKRAARHNAHVGKAQSAPKPRSAMVANAEMPKPNGACVIKPVMSDQDLVNCGATPRYR